MQPNRISIFLYFVILAIFCTITPCSGSSYEALDIFYSNDVGGHTEPCG